MHCTVSTVQLLTLASTVRKAHGSFLFCSFLWDYRNRDRGEQTTQRCVSCIHRCPYMGSIGIAVQPYQRSMHTTVIAHVFNTDNTDNHFIVQ